ncbi:hypothetical protein Taro_047543 [Colocasia esculenta]|uniref:Secreted protein n=1 Tax=Colocasia esculenta TaxID=4460 RepID=A0A843WWE3_COLES|nr:hypothetical protein [Colocasia esculenta]
MCFQLFCSCVASLQFSCARCGGLQLLLRRVSGECGRSLCSCHGGTGLRYAVVLAGAFWRVFLERCLGGSGGGSPRTCLLLQLCLLQCSL